MSAGAFVIANYVSNELNGAIMPMRVQPETLLLFAAGTVNAGSPDPTTLSLFAKARGGRREYGVKARRVTVEFTDAGDIPDGYLGDDLTVPVLLPATYQAYILGSAGTYLGSPIRVISRTPEFAR